MARPADRRKARVLANFGVERRTRESPTTTVGRYALMSTRGGRRGEHTRARRTSRHDSSGRPHTTRLGRAGGNRPIGTRITSPAGPPPPPTPPPLPPPHSARAPYTHIYGHRRAPHINARARTPARTHTHTHGHPGILSVLCRAQIYVFISPRV